MPLFYFNVQTHWGLIRDPEGTEVPDATAAREHAARVARELMRNDELRTRTWRMEVCNAEHDPEFELLFATVDEDLAHLHPELRKTVLDGCKRSASLRDAIQELDRTMLQLRGTIARSERQPYLAAIEGVRI
jgi:hypothetical protein